ncbi:MAG: dehydrogenase [Acidobacteria bacterium CG_4_9_14_3_um_filter_49_7]|nr:MAG: dehydrogenase [Acidobacteria bacterium CG_4_9_14_3_um_filter_49_7]
MISTDVVIVGGGPAGSTTAWKLRQADLDVMVLDKTAFPRLKLCAGWITPRVLKKLEIAEEDYPGGMVRFRTLHFHVYGVSIPVLTRQFSIRRIEFDNWLLDRAGLPVRQHQVRHIEREGDNFIVDGLFRCRWLVGAGGTNCPVYRVFFKGLRPREKRKQIVSMELEFQTDLLTEKCHLWFFRHGLPGYAWYVPKKNGWLNIGLGGSHQSMKAKGQDIREYWQLFTESLMKKKLLTALPPEPGACSYYLRQDGPTVQDGRVLLAGDAAGLATLDMGEGIGPAIESGLLAAETIVQDVPLSFESIPRYSLPGILFPWKR